MKIANALSVPGSLAAAGLEVRQLAITDAFKVSVDELSLYGGEVIPLHYHCEIDEIFYVVEGQADLLTRTEQIALKQGDTVVIPRNVMHSISNPYDRVFRVLSICCPPFTMSDTFFVD